MANHELLGPDKFRGVRTEGFEDIDRGTVTIPATWKDGHTLLDAILDLIEKAKKSIFLTAWAFEEDARVFPALRDAMNRGVSLTILTKPTDRATAALLPLIEKGATVLGHDRFHAKIAIADNQKGIIMTANYTKKGLEEGFEAGVLLDRKDTKILNEIATSLESVCSWKLSAHTLIRDVGEKVRRASKGSRELEVSMILPEVSVELPTYQIDSLEKIPEDLITRELAETAVREKYPGKIIRKVSVKRHIVPPKVPNEAKYEDHKEIPFKVFRTKKSLYIAVTKWEDLSNATTVASRLKAKIVVGS
jgi:phosphatidylserine/phosphatidylglycerophosphate/cardiolipin synthase-like enzyme